MHAEGIGWHLIKVPDDMGLADRWGGQKQSALKLLTCLVSPDPSKGQDQDNACCKAAMLPLPHMLPVSTCEFKRDLQMMQPCLCTSDLIARSLVLHW